LLLRIAMTDLQRIVFSCPTFYQFAKVVNEVRRALPLAPNGVLWAAR
jgi:hypothetical protein